MFNLSDYIGLILIFLFILMRMLREQELKDSFKGIAIIIVIGLYSLYKALPSLNLNLATIMAIIVSCATGIGFGVLRGTTVKIYQDTNTGVWMRRGTFMTILVFIIGIAVNEIIAHVLVHGMSSISSVTQTLHMGLSILGGRLVHLSKRAAAQKRL
ncbi:DUF1453 domain-containing protein [Periweissella ghanensis]|uniref:DUF1453 domain-containing protein n=1 Tax=Periweissella ghanensis TaxID=467997 RepID=A0ABN8BPH7_9LACO|nr:DUF1453 domain-containing protein [Periweissella ghanensis]MCM0600721.1 DUF1453 domain-containing protein [Periweissella ghanensis]CAH0418536.1 hypothetical protein WGH24286_00954 [Periweissella ghanensis]